MHLSDTFAFTCSGGLRIFILEPFWHAGIKKIIRTIFSFQSAWSRGGRSVLLKYRLMGKRNNGMEMNADMGLTPASFPSTLFNMACDTPDYDDGIPIALYGPFTDAKLFGYLGCSVSFFTQNGELFPGIQFCSFAFCAQRIPSTVGFTKVFFVFLRKEPGSAF